MTCRAIIEVDERGRPTLLETEVHHLVRVRRLSAGDTFLGLHLKEAVWYRCRLHQKEEGEWRVEIETRVGTVAESPLEIVLAAALIKKDNFEWMIQKACELGVTEIVPLNTRYVDRRLRLRAHRLLTRWEKVLEESVKQCGRSRVPVLSPVNSLEELLERPPPDLRLVLDPEQDNDFRSALVEGQQATPRSLLLLTGPEGGWSSKERDLFRVHQAGSVHIGPRTLRAETAAVAALSIAQYLWGDAGPKRAESPSES